MMTTFGCFAAKDEIKKTRRESRVMKGIFMCVVGLRRVLHEARSVLFRQCSRVLLGALGGW
jgi:hypothetical protein